MDFIFPHNQCLTIAEEEELPTKKATDRVQDVSEVLKQVIRSEVQVRRDFLSQVTSN